MGAFLREITLHGAEERRETVSGMVAAGALFTTLAASLAERLDLVPARTVTLQFKHGSQAGWPLADVVAAIDGQERTIGNHALDAFPLENDSAEQRLVRKPAVVH
jgi:hypothetical protein